MVKEEHRNIRVAVRVRPNNQHELESNQRTIIKIIDDTSLIFDPEEDEDEFYYQGVKQNYRDITKRVNKKLTMEFDRIFNSESSNESVFEECTKPLVESVMNGYNCSVFVYGATGAGKTFTMLGNENYPGLTFLTMKELFNRISDFEETRKFDIGISYLEVYNEQVMNLLTKTGPLKLREDVNGVVVSGLVLIPIHNAEELITLLLQGNRNRTQHPTDANAESSRSHAIFQVHIRMTEKKTNQKRTVKLSMIDLAGSERAASTKGIGLRFKEGASINKSLLALGNCINKLADGLKHIPYRDSNLTRILKDSLGGNCQTLMIANISPSSLTYEDTYNTLKYASRAKKIRTVVRQNIMKTNMPKEFYVKKVCEQVTENERLKETIKQLELKLSNVTKENNNSFDETEFKTWCKRIDTICSSVIKAQENYYGLQSIEKLLEFKIRQKNNVEKNKKTFKILSTIKVNEDNSKSETSTIDRLNKQISSQKEDMDNWKKRYNESILDLEKLRTEIKSSKLVKIIDIYLNNKEKDIKNSKLELQVNHSKKIQFIIHMDRKNTHKMLSYAFEIIENNYKILNENQLNKDNELNETLYKLIKILNESEQIKLNNEQYYKNGIDDEIMNEIQFGVNEMNFKDDLCTIGVYNNDSFDNNKLKIINNNKRKCTVYEDDNNGLLSKKKNKDNDIRPQSNEMDVDNVDDDINQNLNRTQVLDPLHIINDRNTTFRIPSNPVKINGNNIVNNNSHKKHVEMLKGILSDSNVNAKNGPLISKALIKGNLNGQNILSRVASVSAMSKENAKKFSPNRIRKSPKIAMKTAASRALNSATKLINRQRIRSNTVSPSKVDSSGRVRLNRAASMRTKK